jgi:hypothetical protein
MNEVLFDSYSGFGPGTVDIFRNILGLPEASWEERVEGGEQYQTHDSKQRTISDFELTRIQENHTSYWGNRGRLVIVEWSEVRRN